MFKQSNLIIEKIKNSEIHFKYKKNGKFIFRIYSGDDFENFEYETTLEINKEWFYWIGLPSLLIENNIKISILDISNNNIIEEKILEKEEIYQQSNHIVNKIGEKQYNKIKKYLNYNYYEFFQNHPEYGLEEIDFKKRHINVIDIGSNIGCLGFYLSQFIILDNYICIEPNSQLNYINKIFNKKTKNHKIINKLFYNKNDDEIDYYLPKDNKNSTIATTSLDFKNNYDNYPDNIISKLKTINFKKIIKENNLDIIDILKIDIEGSESYLLEDDENIKIIKDKVKYFLIEVHSIEIKNKFIDIFNKYNFTTEIKNEINNNIFTLQIKNNELIEQKKDVKQNNNKNILLSINCVALGDTICSTPTVRKVSKSYNQKIDIRTYRPDVFVNNPYVDNIYLFNENININNFNEIFETYNTHIYTKCLNKDLDIEIKLSNFEARQLHALGIGMTLYPEEMEYDYIPELEKNKTKIINKDFLIFHVTESWPSRTWDDEKWQRLTNLIKEHTDFKIAIIGKSHKEVIYNGEIEKKVIHLNNIDVNFCDDKKNIGYQNNYNKHENTISDLWHIINNSFALISFDSGPIHLAGTTDTNIIQIGSSIRYEKTTPYRNGNQNYKFYYVGGECNKFCASDIKYSVKEWGTINSMPYLPSCQEKYDKFYCQPTPEQIFFKICEIK